MANKTGLHLYGGERGKMIDSKERTGSCPKNCHSERKWDTWQVYYQQRGKLPELHRLEFAGLK